MKLRDALKLENGQKVMHNRYGECIVKEVVMSDGDLFGVVLTPVTENGRYLLSRDCGCDIPERPYYLEDSIRRISVENIPGTKPIEHETMWGELEIKQGPGNEEICDDIC